jgi:hypothetical protein
MTPYEASHWCVRNSTDQYFDSEGCIQNIALHLHKMTKPGQDLTELNFFFGSPCATLFITVLFLPQLTEVLQYERVIKDQAVPVEAVAALNYISGHPVGPCVS